MTTKPFADNDLRGLIDAIPQVSRVRRRDRRNAARYVAKAATDVDDARLLLDMLGLADVA